MVEKKSLKELEIRPFRNGAALGKWLAKNFGQYDGIWIKFAKKGSGIASITYDEAREQALIYGWIDGQIKSHDEKYFLRKFTPRRPRSKWSKINREIVANLIANGTMQASGMAQVKAAKKDGRWDAAYSSQSNLETPADLQKLLNKNAKAKKLFATISAANRYAFIYRIENCKRAETRERHLKKTIEMLIAGETYHPGR